MRLLRIAATILISSIFWIGIPEFLASRWIGRYGDPLDKIKQILIVDRQLGWRQKNNFNGKFLNTPLRTNELGLRNKPLSEIRNSQKKILVLGPSSTFGWGVEESQAYPAVLQRLLNINYPAVGIEVVNAGEVGFSSWQGLKFYKEIYPQEFGADILIIAYGVNDVDRFRFFYSSPLADKEEFALSKEAWQVSLQNAALRSNFITFLSRRIYAMVDSFLSFPRWTPQRRVEDTDFKKNIEELVRAGKVKGAEIILLTSVYRLPGNNPGGEPQRISRDIAGLNRILEDISVKEAVELVDIDKLLPASEEIGAGMFIDPVHMSAGGHEKIAEELASLIHGRDLMKLKKREADDPG